jgi:2-polyprenyl-6-methoxyphenol hydroxylase-like FAD-dependent oxidoreductase
MMLASELTLADVDVVVVEPRPGPELVGSRARGLHARTIEVLDQRGIADRFLEAGQAVQVQSFAGVSLDIGDFPTRHNHGLALAQKEFERILAGWVEELDVPILREREVTGVTQDDAGVEVRISDGRSLRASYVLGCDGGRSLVRKAAGIDFPGWDASVSSVIAEIEVREEPEWGIRRDATGTQAIGKLDHGKRAGVVVTAPYAGQAGEPTLQELRELMVAAWGTDFGAHDPTWISRFTDVTRQAATYRQGRVLVAGDAAHVHYPVGGQGLNIGVQDAVNLGWKLAQVVHETSPQSLLDTYHDERHPVAAQTLQQTMAATALLRAEPRIDAVRGILAELLVIDEPRRRLAGAISGLDVHYDLGPGHPLLGRRVPDLDLVTAAGPTRAYALLHDARPILLDLGHPGPLDIPSWADRVRVVEAEAVGDWELPVVGEVPTPTAVLVRPDGHVAWVGEGTSGGLEDAVARWFGDPTS